MSVAAVPRQLDSKCLAGLREHMQAAGYKFTLLLLNTMPRNGKSKAERESMQKGAYGALYIETSEEREQHFERMSRLFVDNNRPLSR